MNYKTFGIMLDCSRNAVPTVKTLKKFIDVISDLGYNALQLYIEDTLKVDGQPYLGYMRGGYTVSDIKEVDAYAASHGVELIPALQTLAHFTNTVKLDEYSDIVDVNDILLIGEEKTYKLIDDIFATVAKCFSTKRVNIGMDEAHLVGLGKYLDKHGFCNRHELLVKHLKKVSEIAEKYGFELQMWSDMFFRLHNDGEYYCTEPVLPENVGDDIPANVTPAYWDYYHTAEADYDIMFEEHKKFNRDTWFVGGIWSWIGFAPANAYTLATMKAGIKSSFRYGVNHAIFTMWGDDGKECSFFALLPSIYAISRYAAGEFDDEKIKREFEEKYGIPFDSFSALDMLNTRNGKLSNNPVAKHVFYNDPFLGLLDHAYADYVPTRYAEIEKKLTAALSSAGEYAYIFDSAVKLCRVLEIKETLGLRIRKAYADKNREELGKIVDEMKELSCRLDDFYSAFKTLWYKENKPFGFEVQDARIGGVMNRVRSCRERIEEYLLSGTEIEELETELLPYDRPLTIYAYRRMVSPSEL